MNETAFQHRFLALRDGLYNRAFVLLGDADDAKDAVQETFALLWKQADRLAAMEHPEGYFASTLRHVCLHMLEHRGRTTALSPQLDREDTDDRELMEELEHDRRRLLQMLGRLTPRSRLAVTLRYYQGLDTHHVALAMNVTDVAARAILSRAVAQLRVHLCTGKNSN